MKEDQAFREAFVSVVIPALNEEATIGAVVRAVPREVASEIIVVDNASDDGTTTRAREAERASSTSRDAATGARVARARRRSRRSVRS